MIYMNKNKCFKKSKYLLSFQMLFQYKFRFHFTIESTYNTATK